MSKMPMVAPIYLPGQEPLPPGVSEADREQIKQMTKYQNYTSMAMESCVTKAVLSGVLGFGLGAFFAMMSASFAIDDPLRQTMADRAAMEHAKRLEETAKKEGKAMPEASAKRAPDGPAIKTASVGPATDRHPASSGASTSANPPGASAPKSGILSRLPGAGAFKDLPPPPPQLPEVNTMQSTKQYFIQTGKSMYSSGRGFGKVGALYSGIECVIEGYRAKNDIVNPVVAGLCTGGILARNSGPQAAVGGAVAFAAFSGVIDLLYVPRLIQHSSRDTRGAIACRTIPRSALCVYLLYILQCPTVHTRDTDPLACLRSCGR